MRINHEAERFFMSNGTTATLPLEVGGESQTALFLQIVGLTTRSDQGCAELTPVAKAAREALLKASGTEPTMEEVLLAMILPH